MAGVPKTMDANHSNIAARHLSRNLLSGVLFGVGLAAFLDETLFHQLLHWHHFYDKSTTTAGLVSDGLFHAFSWFATIASLFLLADLRRREIWSPRRWWSGLFLGAGVFQLYDGVVQHKLMKLHQIRYNVEITPYDIGWNILAGVMIAIGVILYREGAPSARNPHSIATADHERR